MRVLALLGTVSLAVLVCASGTVAAPADEKAAAAPSAAALDRIARARSVAQGGSPRQAFEDLAQALEQAAGGDEYYFATALVNTVTGGGDGEVRREFVKRAEPMIAKARDPRAKGHLAFHLGSQLAVLGEREASTKALNRYAAELPVTDWTPHIHYQIAFNAFLDRKYVASAELFDTLLADKSLPASRRHQFTLQAIEAHYAAEHWKRVIELGEEALPSVPVNPRHVVVLEKLVRSYREIGDIAGEVRSCERFIELVRTAGQDRPINLKRVEQYKRRLRSLRQAPIPSQVG